MKRLKGKYLIPAIILVLSFCGIYIGILQPLINRESNTADDDPTKVKVAKETEIREVELYDMGATVIVMIDGKEAAIYVLEDTVVKDGRGNDCTVSDLKAGQSIKAVVAPNVWYEAWIDTETGKSYGRDVYYKCYEVIIETLSF